LRKGFWMTKTESRCPDCGNDPGNDTAPSEPPGQRKCPRCGRSLCSPEPAAGAPARAPWSPLAIGLALGILGIGGSLFLVAFQDPNRPKAGRASAEKSAAGSVDPPVVAIATPVFVIPSKGTGISALVALGEPAADVDRRSLARARQSLLARELIRQAFLIAARDELGMATRDAVLGDWRTGDGNGTDPTAELVIRFRPGGSSRASVRPAARSAGAAVLDVNLPDIVASFAGSTPDDLTKLMEIAEALSRNQFSRVLIALGAAGRANVQRADGPLPAEVGKRHLRLGYTEPFQAIQLLHAANRGDGESPARLGALVRAYALLGILTEFHWHPAHAAFKARALLYAQRLVMRTPGRSWGLWHRAFAEALAGLHKDALADLAQAKTYADFEYDSIAPATAWVSLIEGAALGEASKHQFQGGPLAPLAALLRMNEIELESAPNLLLRAASEVLTVDPECYRAIDAMCSVPTLRNLRRFTALGPQVIDQSVPKSLKSISGLPKGVADHLEDIGFGATKLAESLLAAGDHAADPGEPSWGVLGQLIRETTFVQVYRRLHFLKTIESAPVDEFWSAAQGAVADHPFRQFLELFVSAQPAASLASIKFCEQINLTSLGVAELDLLRDGDDGKRDGATAIRTAIFSHVDHVARDLALLLTKELPSAEVDRVRLARLLLAVSPRSPLARAASVEHDWEDVKLRAPEWQNEAGGSPALLGALGRHARRVNDLDIANRFLRQYIKLSPDAWAYEMLASVYKSQGDSQRWLATLEEYLKRGDDPGLDQARIQVLVAEHFMNQGAFAKARPFADAAALTSSRSAMTTALRCAEAMNDWKNAELWARRMSERFPESCWDEWFLFCKRTGTGDVESARTFADQYVAVASQHPLGIKRQDLGFFYWLAGKPEKAIDSFRAAYDSRNALESGFYGVLVADLVGDTRRRDDLYTSFVKKHRRDAPRTIEVWESLQNAAKNHPGDAVDTHPIDRVMNELTDQSRWHMQFLVGMDLRAHGQDSVARSYLKRSARSPHATKWFIAIARDQVREIDKNAKRVHGEKTSRR
jgi:tetratricopeptide (TPR) repeat protein